MKTYILVQSDELYAYTQDKEILGEFLKPRKNLNLKLTKADLKCVGKEYDMYLIEKIKYGDTEVLSNSYEECIVDDISMFLESSELQDRAHIPYTIFNKRLLPALDILLYTLHSALHDDLESIPPWHFSDRTYLYGIAVGDIVMDRFMILVSALSDPSFVERFRK